ncbi:MAG: TetR/AcrR family transcriptional regulator [Anaerolineae bacterium]|nr:TetR/AcrR family transcriptional regulator [Anaerolineae bacterium]
METDPKEERRQEILLAALRAFAEKGYDKTTVEDIVRISNLSKGTLYWYFENKQAIFSGLIEMVFSEIWRTFEVVLAQTADEAPPDRIRHLLTAFMPVMDESINWVGLYADFFNQAWRNPSLRAEFHDQYKRYIDVLEPVVRQGIDGGYFRAVDSHATAQMLVGALDGYWFQQILDLGNAEPIITQYAETIVRGLMKDDASNG